MMLRKAVAGIVAVLAFGAAASASAVEIGGITLDMSAGNGLFFAGDFGGGIAGVEGKYYSRDVSLSTPWAGGGINLFFDAMYAEIGLNVTGGAGKLNAVIDGVTRTDELDLTFGFAGLGISVLGKYPFAVAEKVTLFPAAGIEYVITLAEVTYHGVDEYGDDKEGLVLIDGNPGEYSALWFKFGGGADFLLTESVFIRPEILYGIRLANKVESNGTTDVAGLNVRDATPILGHGLTFKVGMGCRF